MQRHEHERPNQHHFKPYVQIEDVTGEERPGNTHQNDLDQRVKAQRFASRVDARKRRSGHRHPDDADHHDHQRTEHVNDQRDAKWSRPRRDLKHLNAGALHPNEDPDRCGKHTE
jgi:hypothetical protein